MEVSVNVSLTIQLPTADRHLKTYTVNSQRWAAPTAPISIKKRKVFSAVHVVADPWAVDDPLRDVGIDWNIRWRIAIIFGG